MKSVSTFKKKYNFIPFQNIHYEKDSTFIIAVNNLTLSI